MELIGTDRHTVMFHRIGQCVMSTFTYSAFRIPHSAFIEKLVKILVAILESIVYNKAIAKNTA